MKKTITGPGWSLVLRVDGDDLVVDSTQASWFGGDNDPQDSGETASGVLTKGHPDLLACSLPMRYLGPHGPTREAMLGCPIPMLPYRTTLVEVTRSGKTVKLPLIDIGPAKSARHGIDLTQAAFKALGGNLRDGLIQVSYRILGGANHVQDSKDT